MDGYGTVINENGEWTGVPGFDDDWIAENPGPPFVRAKAGGIANNQAVMKGASASSHINLGFEGSVTGDFTEAFCTVSGGRTNTAEGWYATVAGGNVNVASGFTSVVGGGTSNTASGSNATVGGGINNSASNIRDTVSGGEGNTASGTHSTVGGGKVNIASGSRSTVGGGISNTANGGVSTIAGGIVNAATGSVSTVAGGSSNQANGDQSTVAGGMLNEANGMRSSVAGGWGNVAGGISASVGGGYNNKADGDYSWAGGSRMHLSSTADNSFVWGHSDTDAQVINTSNAFLIFPKGNRGKVGIQTDSPGFDLEVNGTAGKPGGGSWSSLSDRRLKRNIVPFTGVDALQKLCRLQGVTYEWIHPEEHEPGVRAGVIAQDLETVFPSWVHDKEPTGKDKSLIPEGEISKAIHFPHDFNAYLIEAIKELKSQNDQLKQRIEVLERVDL